MPKSPTVAQLKKEFRKLTGGDAPKLKKAELKKLLSKRRAELSTLSPLPTSDTSPKRRRTGELSSSGNGGSAVGVRQADASGAAHALPTVPDAPTAEAAGAAPTVSARSTADAIREAYNALRTSMAALASAAQNAALPDNAAAAANSTDPADATSVEAAQSEYSSAIDTFNRVVDRAHLALLRD